MKNFPHIPHIATEHTEVCVEVQKVRFVMTVFENMVKELLSTDVVTAMGGATRKMKTERITPLEKCKPMICGAICMLGGVPDPASDVIRASLLSV